MMACKRGPREPATFYNLHVSVSAEHGTDLHVRFGLNDNGGSNTQVDGTVAVTVLEGAKPVCNATVPAPVQSYHADYFLDATLATPCLSPTKAARTAKVVFTSAKGTVVEGTTQFDALPALSSYPKEKPPPAAPSGPWDAKVAASIVSQLPAPTAADKSCPDPEIMKNPRHDRVQLFVVDDDDLRLAAHQPLRGVQCAKSEAPKLPMPEARYLLVQMASSCVHPKALPDKTFDAGHFKGLVAVVDMKANGKSICWSNYSATNKDTVKVYGTAQEAAWADFQTQVGRERFTALTRISRFIEDPVSGSDPQEMGPNGHIY